jgi:hypothetical protein
VVDASPVHLARLELEADDYGYAAVVRRVMPDQKERDGAAGSTFSENLGCDADGYVVPALLITAVNGKSTAGRAFEDVRAQIEKATAEAAPSVLTLARASSECARRFFDRMEAMATLEDAVAALDARIKSMEDDTESLTTDVDELAVLKAGLDAQK